MVPALPAALAATASLALAGCGESASASERSREWPAYLGGDDRAQYSPATEITPANVSRLELAWTYRAGGADPANRSQIQCNPIVVDGVLYATSP